MKQKCMRTVLSIFCICLACSLAFSQEVIELRPPMKETANGVILKVDLARSTVLIKRTEPGVEDSELRMHFTERTTIRYGSKEIEPTKLSTGQQVIVKYESERRIPIINNEIMPPEHIHTAREIEVIQLVSSETQEAVQASEKAPSPKWNVQLESKRVSEFLSAFSQSFDKVNRSLVPVMITRKKARFGIPWESFFDEDWEAIIERMEGGTNGGTGKGESEWMMVEASAIAVGPQHVLLPNSLLANAERIDVHLLNGAYTAEVLAFDTALDLALLTVICDRDTLIPCEWVDTDLLGGGQICAGLLRSSGGHLQFALCEVEKGGSIPRGSQWLPYGATLFDDAGRVLGMAVLEQFEVSNEKGRSVRNVLSAIPASRIHKAILGFFREEVSPAEEPRIWLRRPEQGNENVRWFMAAKKSAEHGPLTYDGSWLLLDQDAYASITLEQSPALLELRVTGQGTSRLKGTIWRSADADIARINIDASDKTLVSILDVGKTNLILAVGNETYRLSLVAYATADGMVQVQIERAK